MNRNPVVFSGFLVIIFAIASGNGMAALLAIPLLLYWLVSSFPQPPLKLYVNRVLSHICLEEGTTFKVTLEVTNQGMRGILIFIDDVIPQNVKVIKERSWRIISLSAGESARWSYEGQAMRGKKKFTDVRYASLLFGLKKVEKIPSQTENILWVSPKILLKPSVIMHANSTLFQSGLNASRRGGAGLEFFEVRKFQFGDRLRNINWRVSSKYENEIYLNELESENQANALIVLDSRSNLVSKCVLEHELSAAATLAQQLMTLSNRVSFLGIGGSLTKVGFGKGRQHYAKLASTFASIEPGHNYCLTELECIPLRHTRRRCLMIFIGPLSARDVSRLVAWKMQGHHIIVLSPNYISIETIELGKIISPQKQYAHERSQYLLSLKQRGINSIDWHPHKMDFLSVLQLLGEYSRPHR